MQIQLHTFKGDWRNFLYNNNKSSLYYNLMTLQLSWKTEHGSWFSSIVSISELFVLVFCNLNILKNHQNTFAIHKLFPKSNNYFHIPNANIHKSMTHFLWYIMSILPLNELDDIPKELLHLLCFPPFQQKQKVPALLPVG